MKYIKMDRERKQKALQSLNTQPTGFPRDTPNSERLTLSNTRELMNCIYRIQERKTHFVLSYKSLGSYGSAWISQFQDNKQFLQIDLGAITKVTRIAHQGRGDAGWWTKSFTISYSNDGAKFTPYDNDKVCRQFVSRHFPFKISCSLPTLAMCRCFI